MAPPEQLAFVLRTRGGRRKGAGRKPPGAEALVSHHPRPKFGRPTPAHVTLRLGKDIPSLRAARRFAIVRQCFKATRGRCGLRLVEFSVLGNHLHLVMEADSNESLSRGVQGLCVRLAKALNAALQRAGKVFADHYHSRLLCTPTELVNAIRYVLNNAENHYGEPGPDWCSSEAPGAEELLGPRFSWLLRAGWQRAPRHILARLLALSRYRLPADAAR
jgi:putative transposase